MARLQVHLKGGIVPIQQLLQLASLVLRNA